MPAQTFVFGFLFSLLCAIGYAAEPAVRSPIVTPGDKLLADYFRQQTLQLKENCLAEIKTAADWQAKRAGYRQQLFKMLGLDPLPERTPLRAELTGKVDSTEIPADIVVEKIQFQSLPGLYVTGNLYLPKTIDKPLPAVLYVCGHGDVKINGVSYGNKAFYPQNGVWFAQKGYACLMIDSLQLGEIEGIHHGTHRYSMWWWINRGYTPAGVEAWNCIRALDYLETRKEIDPKRFGVTGRSGGGAYSWWIAALDDRIKAAVPAAGITDLHNHVIDGCVEGHCDCMFFLNTYGWDYPLVAALCAPRPVMINNTDRDSIFPEDGVRRTYEAAKRIYKLLGAEEKLQLTIAPGGHVDGKTLQRACFTWFDKYLKEVEPREEISPEVKIKPQALRVFASHPKDQINTKIQETFVAAAPSPQIPQDKSAWEKDRDAWLKLLAEESFGGWPKQPVPLDAKRAFQVEKDGLAISGYEFISQEHVPLTLYVVQRAGGTKPELLVLNVPEEAEWQATLAMLAPLLPADKQPAEFAKLADADKEAAAKALKQHQAMFKANNWALGWVAVRGIGPTRSIGNIPAPGSKYIQMHRRYMLLGQTLDGQRVWDVRRAIQAVRSQDSLKEVPLWLAGEGTLAGVALYASLFEPNIARLDLTKLPANHRGGPIFLNVQRYLDMPQAVAMAAERSRVLLYQEGTSGWEYPQAVVEKLGLPAKHLQIRKLPPK